MRRRTGQALPAAIASLPSIASRERRISQTRPPASSRSGDRRYAVGNAPLIEPGHTLIGMTALHCQPRKPNRRSSSSWSFTLPSETPLFCRTRRNWTRISLRFCSDAQIGAPSVIHHRPDLPAPVACLLRPHSDRNRAELRPTPLSLTKICARRRRFCAVTSSMVGASR